MPTSIVRDSVPAVKLSRRLTDARPEKAKYRVTWGDGCFFTMLVSTVRGVVKTTIGADRKEKIEFDDTPVASDAPECWLWVRLLNNLNFDDKYAREFPAEIEAVLQDDKRLGKWSIAFNLRDISAEGVAKAYFVDEWWKDIESASCSGSGKIVARYIMATRTILAKHAPQISAAPAAQSAVCDPLKYDKEDPVPSFEGMAVDDRIAAFRPIYDELKKLNFTHGELTDNTVKEMPRPWNKQHGPLIEAVRKLALQKLFQAGAWRIAYFQGLGGSFSFSGSTAIVPPELRVLLGIATPDFAKVLEEQCEEKARDAYISFKAWLNRGWSEGEKTAYRASRDADLENPEYKTISDTHFEAWFRSELYLQQAMPINGEWVYSRHPLHLEEFKLDVISAGAHLANKYGDHEWFKGNKIERFTEGTMP